MQNEISITVLDKNQNSLKIIEEFLRNTDFSSDITFYEDYQEGLEKIKNSKSVVICDISNMSDDEEEFLKEIKLYSSKLIVTSSNYSTDTIIKALRAGAKEFLPKPVIKENLIHTLTMLINKPEKEEYNNSKIISIYSNKGGIGKTTVAINLASELAKVTGENIALVDLNLQLGDISTFLNLNPTFDVNYVIRKLLNKDYSVVKQVLEQYNNSSLYVLADPAYIEQAESIKPAEITELFNVLRKLFPYIIVDMSSSIDSNTLNILDNSDIILFTTIINLPAIRNAQRCLNLFRSRKYPQDKVKVIVNRFMENDEISIQDIENTLDEKIYWKIPNNYFTVMEAINKGKVVSDINLQSNITNSFRDLASKLSEEIIEQAVLKYRG